MTISAKDRTDAVGAALRRMSEDLGDRWIAAGLIAAMKVTGELETPEHKERCIQLRKALQALVKGREVLYGGADVFSLVASSGLSDQWIFNAIDARFLNYLWPDQHVEVEWRNREVRVSRAFGHRRLFGFQAGPVKPIPTRFDE